MKARRDDDTFCQPWDDEVYHSAAHENWSKSVMANIVDAVQQLKQQDPQHRRMWIVWLADETFVGADLAQTQLGAPCWASRTCSSSAGTRTA